MMNRENTTMHLSASMFLTQLMYISQDIVWKNAYLANKSEDPNYSIETEIFMAASRNMLTFDTIYQFDRATLEEVGMSEIAIDAAMDDKYSIPLNMRTICTRTYIKRLLLTNPDTGHYINYIEHNNYYRMLMGLPDIGDEDFVYNTEFENIPQNIPVHLMSISDRYNLEQLGYLETLKELYPKKKYLQHIASRQIDVFTARIADKFAILHMRTTEFENLTTDFKDLYNNCRYTIIRVYYNDVYRKNNEFYDNFLALCILFMTTQMMHYKYLDVDITRDFYDLESIRYIYDSYSVPFFSSIPIQYHTKIIKNINKIISYKGSTRVFYDLFEIFNFGSMDVYEYYIIKSHKLDHRGIPIFVYDDEGNPDTRAMYDIKFGKVRLYDDPPLELSDTANIVSYESMITGDPYWMSDPDLLDKLYEENFNYLESKYIGIQTVFDMMKIVIEASYFIQMLVSNRATLNSTTILFNNTNTYINIFDMIIYLSALICQKYGYEGNISTNLPTVSKIMGFNFKESATIIQNQISKNPILSGDQTLNDLLLNMNVNSLASVNNTFTKIKSLQVHLTEMISSSSTTEEYFAYYNLNKALMYSNVMEDLYRKRDDTVAESFKDLLSDINGELYIRLLSPELQIDDEINTLLVGFQKAVTDLEYFESVDGIDISNIIQYLFTILEFFKSAKAELTGYNVTYILSNRGMNIIKLFGEMYSQEHASTFYDKIDYLKDKIHNILHTSVRLDDEMKLLDLEDLLTELSIYFEKDELVLEDAFKIYQEVTSLVDGNEMVFFDDILKSEDTNMIHEKMPLSDMVRLTSMRGEIYFDSLIVRLKDNIEYFKDMTNILLNDIIRVSEEIILLARTETLTLFDDINIRLNNNQINEPMMMADQITLVSNKNFE